MRFPRLWRKSVPIQDATSEAVRLRESMYVAYLSLAHEERLTALDKKIQEVEGQLVVAQDDAALLRKGPQHRKAVRALGAATTDIKRLSGQKAELLKQRLSSESTIEIFRQQYRAILAIPRLLGAWVEPPRLVYETDVLFGKDHQDRWRKIGRFRISFDMLRPSRETIIWDNLDGARDQFEGPPNIRTFAPSVGTKGGGSSCMGSDVDAILAKAKEMLDYPTIVAVTVRYPECRGSEYNKTIEFFLLDSRVPEWYIKNFGR